MRAIAAILTLLVLVAASDRFCSVSGAELAQDESPLILSDSDRAEIIRLILEQRLAEEGEEKFKEYLVLADDNIQVSMVPKIQDFRITLARSKDLKRKAQRTPGGLKWMFFGEFKVKGQHVEVDFVRRQMFPGKPPRIPPLVRGPHYQCFFRRVAGKWEGSCPLMIC